jgi:hypothetical protein
MPLPDLHTRVMSAPATQLVNTISGVDPSEASSAPSIAGLSGVRVVRRLKGVVRGVLVELPATYHRGDTINAFKGMPDVSDVEEEGVVTVQIANGECGCQGTTSPSRCLLWIAAAHG